VPGVVEPVPVGTIEQLVGIELPEGIDVSPITCIGTKLATSLLALVPSPVVPPIFTLANLTVPKKKL